MKKTIAILLLLFATLGLCACSTGSNEPTEPTKTAFTASKEAYETIQKAYEITESFGSDLYEAWRLGVYNDDDITSYSTSGGVNFLAEELSLTQEELVEGYVYIKCGGTQEDYENTDETLKEMYRDVDSCNRHLRTSDSTFSACVWLVTNAYEANGKAAQAREALAEAKAMMREMSEKYSDYEHYPNLKGYYTTTSAFFDFCNEPTGSFEQVKTTINDYRNEARNYVSDLDYIFED